MDSDFPESSLSPDSALSEGVLFLFRGLVVLVLVFGSLGVTELLESFAFETFFADEAVSLDLLSLPVTFSLSVTVSEVFEEDKLLVDGVDSLAAFLVSDGFFGLGNFLYLFLLYLPASKLFNLGIVQVKVFS